MLKKIRCTISALLLFGVGYCQAGAFSVSDMIAHFNMIESEVSQFDVEDCKKIAWLQKGLCAEILE